VSLRRIFLLGAATIVSFAALVAIVAIVNGEFGETEGRIFSTLAAAFVAGSTAIAGMACLERGVSRPLGVLGVILSAGGFILWAEQIWNQHDSEAYWKVLGVIVIWTVAILIVTTTRLMTRSPELLRTLFLATVVATSGAALVVTRMVLSETGDGWQLFAVLLVLAALGEILTPILQRFVVIRADDATSERVLGQVAGAVVVAVRASGGSRSIQLADREVPFREDETIVVRPA
jgi:hypothetical protein